MSKRPRRRPAEGESSDSGSESDSADLAVLKRQNPEHHRRFVRARSVMKIRELTMKDILSCDISDDKRATLIEKFECLKNIEPCTEDYLDSRDRLRSLYYRYLSETNFGSPIFRSLSGDKKLTESEKEVVEFKEKIGSLVCSPANRKVFEEKIE